MRTAVYDGETIEFFEDGVLLETIYVVDKSVYWIDDAIYNWENMPV
jgi:hypothetical protein